MLRIQKIPPRGNPVVNISTGGIYGRLGTRTIPRIHARLPRDRRMRPQEHFLREAIHHASVGTMAHAPPRS